MVFRGVTASVLIFLCLLITQAPCRPVESGARDAASSATINMILVEIRRVLDHLSDPRMLPNIACASLNVTEQLLPEQQPLTAHHLSSFRCYMQALSKRIPELSEHLDTSSQYLQAVEQQQCNQTVPVTCKLPTFEQDFYDYAYAKCLLQLVDKRLSNSKIRFQ